MIRVQREDFDVGQEINRFSNDKHDIGAVCTFLGLVRDLAGDSIKTMTLDYYPGMTEKNFRRSRQRRGRDGLSPTVRSYTVMVHWSQEIES